MAKLSSLHFMLIKWPELPRAGLDMMLKLEDVEGRRLLVLNWCSVSRWQSRYWSSVSVPGLRAVSCEVSGVAYTVDTGDTGGDVRGRSKWQHSPLPAI